MAEPNDISSLVELGWDSHFESCAALHAGKGWLPYRVVGEERGMWRIQGDGTGVVWGEIPGKWRKDADNRLDLPAVGDWVMADPPSHDRHTQVRVVLERRSCLVRKAAGTGEVPQVLAANVDIAFLVSSLNQDLSLRRLERYLALVLDGGARPVVLLTKSDLVPDSDPLLAQVKAIAAGADVVVLSAKTGHGIETIRSYLSPGKTVVLLGSSGVGKSTLINKLLGREKLKVQEARGRDDKGRHTTTARYLLPVPNGGLIIDTPGMREIQLWDQEEGVETLFAEIEELGLQCRFTNCQHANQPGCAVRAALSAGTLTRQRFDSYLKLQDETKKGRTPVASSRHHVRGRRGGTPDSKK